MTVVEPCNCFDR